MIDIEDSMGNMLQVSKGDTDFSARCGYSECEIKCASQGEIKDTSKFHIFLHSFVSIQDHCLILYKKLVFQQNHQVDLKQLFYLLKYYNL